MLFRSHSKSSFFFAILADGYLSFKVKILEYCDKEDTFTKEQYYIDLLKPKYNIPKVAGGSFAPAGIHIQMTSSA